MAAVKIVLDSSNYKRSIFKFRTLIAENLRVAMLESMRLVATTSVNDFMVPHELTKSEKTKGIGRRSGGTLLGILTSRLKRSIMDEDSEFGREGIRRVFIKSNVIIGEMGSKVPYAAIHEFGGQTGRGLKTTIPARPYLLPALKKSEPEIKTLLQTATNVTIIKSGL